MDENKNELINEDENAIIDNLKSLINNECNYLFKF
jgi:hypothetical protein